MSDMKGYYVPERVFNEDTPVDCTEWKPVGSKQLEIRTMLFGLQGDNCVRVLHQMPATIMEDLNEEDDMSDTPNFEALLREGMNRDEREDQLLHETGDDGLPILDEEGRKRRRPNHQVRKFACDPHGYVQLDWSVGLFWPTEKVVKHIVSKEAELGYLAKSKRTPKKKTASTVEPKEKETMATGKRVLLGRNKKPAAAAPATAAAPDETAKLGRPPKRRGATHTPAEDAAPAQEVKAEGLAACKAPHLDDIQVAAGAGVEPLTTELGNRILSRLAEVEDTQIRLFTILHDLLVQTNGTMNYPETPDDPGGPMEQVWDEPRKILKYLDDVEAEAPETMEIAARPK